MPHLLFEMALRGLIDDAEAFVWEHGAPRLASLAVGDPVTLQCDGCPAPIPAHVDRIATEAEYTPPVIYSNAQRSRLVFLAEARPDRPASAGLKPGQPLDVRRTPKP